MVSVYIHVVVYEGVNWCKDQESRNVQESKKIVSLLIIVASAHILFYSTEK